MLALALALVPVLVLVLVPVLVVTEATLLRPPDGETGVVDPPALAGGEDPIPVQLGVAAPPSNPSTRPAPRSSQRRSASCSCPSSPRPHRSRSLSLRGWIGYRYALALPDR